MSRLTDLIAAARNLDEQLGADLEAEILPLQRRLPFGLNFERHQPEAVELAGHPVRPNSKVRILGERGLPASDDRRRWRVNSVSNGHADLTEMGAQDPEERTAPLSDLVVVAEFRDRIYPGLRVDDSVRRGGDRPHHLVINAENFHALKLLTFTHAGKVDAMYIDPPYNTGARVWKYNNDYVDKEDLYRHSKWLAFMERRLKVAQRLLNPVDSVLIVTIDENEVHRLALLLEQTFPGCKIQMITALINPAGASIIDQFSRVDEQILFVHIGDARPVRTSVDTTPGTSSIVDSDGVAKAFSWEAFQRSGGNSRRQDTKAKFFPVYIDEINRRIVGCGDHLPLDESVDGAPPAPAGTVAQWPIKSDGTDGCWQLSAPTFREYLSAGRIRLGRRTSTTGRWGLSFLTKGHMAAIERGELVVNGRANDGSLVVENAPDTMRSQVGKTMWTSGAYSATEHGSRLLRKFLPRRRFPFPKSLYAVEDALRFYLQEKPNAIVVDPFAGSGTTLHAVLRLNHEDGGTRQAIVITNNEVSDEEEVAFRSQGLRPGDEAWESYGICEYITKPRVRAAITGLDSDGNRIEGSYRFRDEFPMADGFEENADFLSLTYESPWRVSTDHAFQAIAPLLWMRAGAQGEIIQQLDPGWAVTPHYAILRDLDRSADFIAACLAQPTLRTAFLITEDERRFQMVADELPSQVEPVRLYENYMENFKIVDD